MHRRLRRRCAARRAFVSHGEKVWKTLMSIDASEQHAEKVREDLNRTETARGNIKVLTDLRVLCCPLVL